MKLTIATRGSALALWQANHIRDRLLAADPARTIELLVLKTTGDKITDRALAEVGGKGLFVKEIEEALLDGRADLAVHSLKDVPADLPAGLGLVAIPERADPRDALVVAQGRVVKSLDDLPQGAKVGTSSLRRVCQLRARRPDVVTDPVRGNVDTRLRKLDSGQYDALLLASAGLDRLGWGERISWRVPPEIMLPAVGQAALAIECRLADASTRAALGVLNHAPTATCITAERAFLRTLEGGCQTPIAASAELADGQLTIEGLVGAPDGSTILRATERGPAEAAEALGRRLAEGLLDGGAATFLRRA